jgi:hypothetical protein
MDIDAPKQKIGKFMRILSSIRKKLPDRRTFLIYKSNFYNLTKLGMILGLVVFLFCALIFVGLPAAIWADVHRDFRSFVRFEYGNGKETILLIEPEDKISLIESQLRDKLNVSSKYVVDLFVGGWFLTIFRVKRHFRLQIRLGEKPVRLQINEDKSKSRYVILFS